MKFAICNETFQDWPIEKGLEFARDSGYTGIEFAPFTIDKDVRNISSSQRRDIAKHVERADLETVGLHWLLAFTEGFHLTSPDSGVRQATGQYLAELARLCRDLGGQTLVLGSPQQRNLLDGMTHDRAMEFAADVLQQVVETLHDCEVVLAIEPLGPEEGDFLLTAEQGCRLIEMVGDPSVQLHLDVKAMASEETPIPDIIREHAGQLRHFHANDANRKGPGMGDVDFIPILSALKEVRYDGWVSVEVFDYSPGPEVLARASIGYLQKCLAAINA